MRATVVLLIGFGMLSPAGPGIQNAEWEVVSKEALENRADEELDRLRGEGDRELSASEGGFHTGALAENEAERVLLEVSDVDQVVLAVCDSDCVDIDFYLYDADGVDRCVDVDVDNDLGRPPTLMIPDCGFDYPETDEGAELEPGAYELELYMASCDVEPCYYAVQVYDLVDPGR